MARAACVDDGSFSQLIGSEAHSPKGMKLQLTVPPLPLTRCGSMESGGAGRSGSVGRPERLFQIRAPPRWAPCLIRAQGVHYGHRSQRGKAADTVEQEKGRHLEHCFPPPDLPNVVEPLLEGKLAELVQRQARKAD